MKIIWKETEIARVEAEGGDFPTFFGRFTLCENIPANTMSYVDFCERTWPLIEDGKFTDEYYEEEALYIDLIENNEWWLENEKGQKEPILIPVFCTNREVNWRLDPSR